MNDQEQNRTTTSRTRHDARTFPRAMRYAACFLVFLAMTGCEPDKSHSAPSSEPAAKPRQAAPATQPAHTATTESKASAESTQAAGSTTNGSKQAAGATPSGHAAAAPQPTGPATPETLKLDSNYYPQDLVTKVSLDNMDLTTQQAYARLIPALVKFIASSGETEYRTGTAVMRPAIHLDTAGGVRHSYMLVVGEPAIRYYSPDKTWNPWLIGDDKLYEDLFQALQALYPNRLPRGDH